MSKSEVRVNTATLRGYADQLGGVSCRVDGLRERLMRLASASAGATCAAAEVLARGNNKIEQCRGYLSDTATDLETVDRKIALRM